MERELEEKYVYYIQEPDGSIVEVDRDTYYDWIGKGLDGFILSTKITPSDNPS